MASEVRVMARDSMISCRWRGGFHASHNSNTNAEPFSTLNRLL